MALLTQDANSQVTFPRAEYDADQTNRSSVDEIADQASSGTRATSIQWGAESGCNRNRRRIKSGCEKYDEAWF